MVDFESELNKAIENAHKEPIKPSKAVLKNYHKKEVKIKHYIRNLKRNINRGKILLAVPNARMLLHNANDKLKEVRSKQLEMVAIEKSYAIIAYPNIGIKAKAKELSDMNEKEQKAFINDVWANETRKQIENELSKKELTRARWNSTMGDRKSVV